MQKFLLKKFKFQSKQKYAFKRFSYGLLFCNSTKSCCLNILILVKIKNLILKRAVEYKKRT